MSLYGSGTYRGGLNENDNREFPEKAAEVAQRLHIKKDEIPFVRKYYTAEKDKTEVKKKERAVISYISTGIKDRDGEKLIPDGVVLDNYTKNPIVPFGHNYKSIPFDTVY